MSASPGHPPSRPLVPPEERRRARAVFESALDLPPSDRAAFIEAACQGSGAVLGEVRALLAALEAVGEGEPAIAPTQTRQADGADRLTLAASSMPKRIGAYRLLERIGEGGFGEVFLAEQERPIRRRVAIKIVKLGMDSRRVVARFEQERQALAMMDHPNIARVLDGGATDDGRPYFVMELVRGEPITTFCESRDVPLRERIQLARTVCEAVQHAHQKGIIHRDLKPSNVLVALSDVGGGRPLPKVIDFGIAKATGEPLTDKTLFTEHRQLVGTPEYMSPEQAEMTAIDIDTRTDVYALGVLLYELLTGTTPLDGRRLRTASLGEMLRLIREDAPERPSTRLLTAHRSAVQASPASRSSSRSALPEPHVLSRLIRGDLDWIVMKALEKDRTRRYDSAGALAADLQRFLDGRAVEAGPPGVIYQVRTAVRRNKAAVLAFTAVSLAITVGLFLALAGLFEARRERDDAIIARAGENAAREAAFADRATALRALDAAKRAGEESERRRDEAERALYRATLATAAAAIQSINGAAAISSLRSVPESARGWEWQVLKTLAGRASVTLDVPPDERTVRAMPLHDPDRALAHTDTAGALATLVWDTRSGAVVRRFPGGHGAASPNGRLIAIPLDGGQRLAAFEADSGRPRWSVPAPPGGTWAVHAASFSLDSTTLVASDGQGDLRFFSADSGQPLEVLRTDPPARSPVGFVNLGSSGPAQHVLYLGQRLGGLNLFLVDRQDPAHQRDFSFAYDLSAFRSHLIRNSTLATLVGGHERIVPQTRLAGAVIDPDIDPAGRTIVLADTLGGVALAPLPRSARSGLPPAPGVDPPATQHFPAIAERADSVTFTSDGESLLLVGNSGRASVVPSDAYAAAFSVPSDVGRAGRFSPDGSLLVRFGWGGVSVFDTLLGLPIWARAVSSRILHTAAWSADGRRLLLATLPSPDASPNTSEIYVLDADSGRQRLALGPTASEPDPRFGRAAAPWVSHVADAAFLADGRLCALALADGAMLVLDTDTGQPLESPRLTPQSPASADPGIRLVASPDRQRLAHLAPPSPSAHPTGERAVFILDAASLAQQACLAIAGRSAVRAAFSPAGDSIYVGYADGSIARWRLEDASLAWHAGPYSSGIVALAVAPDGSRLAAFSPASQAMVIETASGTLLAELPLPGTGLFDAAFTPDASLQITSSALTLAALSPRPRLEPVPRMALSSWPRGVEPPAYLQRARARVMDAYALLTGRCSPLGRGIASSRACLDASDQRHDVIAIASAIAQVIGLPLRENNNEALLVLLDPRADRPALERAALLLAELCERYPTDPPVRGNLGHALARLDRWAEAVGPLQASIRLREERGLPPYAHSLALLALAHDALGQREASRAAVSRALHVARAAGESPPAMAPSLQPRWDALRAPSETESESVGPGR